MLADPPGLYLDFKSRPAEYDAWARDVCDLLIEREPDLNLTLNSRVELADLFVDRLWDWYRHWLDGSGVSEMFSMTQVDKLTGWQVGWCNSVFDFLGSVDRNRTWSPHTFDTAAEVEQFLLTWCQEHDPSQF
jgi:hypothetical protein